MQHEIAERLHDVAVGDLVRWNGRPAPEVVVAVTDEWFDVRNAQHDIYRFYPEAGFFVDRAREERDTVDSFEVVGDVCDVDVW